MTAPSPRQAHFSSLSAPSPERRRDRRSMPSIHALRDRHRQGDDTTAVEISDLRPARNQGSVGG
jgi:hypothetical protein